MILRRLLFRRTIALALVVLGALTPVARTDAAPAAAVLTALIIQPQAPLPLGDHPTIRASLTTGAGVPISGEWIELFLDGMRQRRAMTDSMGVASFTIRRNLVAGPHTLRAVYNGSRTHEDASAVGSISIQQWELIVRTVPPLLGVPFALDGRRFSSGPDGIARLMVERIDTYRLEILATENTEPEIAWLFQRWESDLIVPFRDLQLPAARSIEAGFNVRYRVRPAFVDLSGHPVDPGRIEQLTLKNSIGGLYTFDNGQPQWLQANRVLRRQHGIEEVQILYAVESVIVDSSNIVNQSQQRFYVNPNNEWRIELLLFSTTFAARDALFGSPIGNGVWLEHPNGHVQEIPFGADAQVTIRSLVRGIYRVSVIGAPGISTVSPVAQSRDQEVQLLVISYIDLAIVISILAGLGFGLLFAGRPQLRALLWNPRGALSAVAQACVRGVAALRTAMRQPGAVGSLASALRATARVQVQMIVSGASQNSLEAGWVEPQMRSVAPLDPQTVVEEYATGTATPAHHSRHDPTLTLAAALIGLGAIAGVAGLNADVQTDGQPATAVLAVRIGGSLLALSALLVLAFVLSPALRVSVGRVVFVLATHTHERRHRLHAIVPAWLVATRRAFQARRLVLQPGLPDPVCEALGGLQIDIDGTVGGTVGGAEGVVVGAGAAVSADPVAVGHPSDAGALSTAPRSLGCAGSPDAAIKHAIEQIGARHAARVRVMSSAIGLMLQVDRASQQEQCHE